LQEHHFTTIAHDTIHAKKTDTRASAFLTLTSTLSREDLGSLDKQFKQFIRQLSSHLGYQVAYSAVVELTPTKQKLHYHVCLYEVDYIQMNDLRKMWPWFVFIKSIEKGTNVGLYMAKYLTKDSGWRLPYRKRYRSSRGLLKPLIHTMEEVVNTVLMLIPPNVQKFVRNYFSHHVGEVTETEYDLNNSPNVLYDIQAVLTAWTI
jgi:hypothetical protein